MLTAVKLVDQGANLIVLAQSQRWVPAFVEKALLTDLSCAQHVLIAPRVQDVLTEDPIELGVNKYRAAVTEVHPEYGMTVPSKSACDTHPPRLRASILTAAAKQSRRRPHRSRDPVARTRPKEPCSSAYPCGSAQEGICADCQGIRRGWCQGSASSFSSMAKASKPTQPPRFTVTPSSLPVPTSSKPAPIQTTCYIYYRDCWVRVRKWPKLSVPVSTMVVSEPVCPVIPLRHALRVELLANGRIPSLEVALKRVGDLLQI